MDSHPSLMALLLVALSLAPAIGHSTTGATVVLPSASSAVVARLIVDSPDAVCPAEAALQAQVRACLRPEAARAGRRLVGEVRITQVARTLEGRLRMVSGGAAIGERRLIGAKDCRELMEAAALAMCIALDAIVATDQVKAARVKAAEVKAAEAKAEEAARPPVAAPLAATPVVGGGQAVARSDAGWVFGLAMVGSVEVQPGYALGGSFGLGWQAERWSAGFEARYEQPPTATLVEGGGLRSSLNAYSLVLCPYRIDGVGFCAVATYGTRNTEGEGFVSDRGGMSDYLSIGPRLSVQIVSWGPVALGFQAEASRSLLGLDAKVDERVVWPSPSLGYQGGVWVTVLSGKKFERVRN